MLDVTQTDREIGIRMPATLEAIDEADDRVTACLRTWAAPVDVFATRILLREALLNAVTHGSDKDPGKTVSLTLGKDPTGLTMVVEDSGPGFAWQARRRTMDVLADGGRGLALMELYSDGMAFNEKGNRLVLHKKWMPSETGDKTQDTHKETVS